jgi:hypothetical protein
MTKPNDGKHDTRIHRSDDAIEQRNLMNLRHFAQGISIGLGICLTIYLSCREQYLDSLLGLTLTIAAATSDRLKRIRIGLQGLQSEWRDPPR